IMSHSARAQTSSASAPLEAVRTSKYSADSRASKSLTLAGTSSTTRMRADIENSPLPDKSSNSFNKFADRDRLGQICFAATLADAFLVTLHGKGGDRDYRNGPQLRIVLDPPRHLEAGYLGELNIHQDEIGTKFADEIKRLETVAGTGGLIAVRLQQIAKELHIELVVLHDQDGFCHPAPPIRNQETHPARGAGRTHHNIPKMRLTASRSLPGNSLYPVKTEPHLHGYRFPL